MHDKGTTLKAQIRGGYKKDKSIWAENVFVELHEPSTGLDLCDSMTQMILNRKKQNNNNNNNSMGDVLNNNDN